MYEKFIRNVNSSDFQYLLSVYVLERIFRIEVIPANNSLSDTWRGLIDFVRMIPLSIPLMPSRNGGVSGAFRQGCEVAGSESEPILPARVKSFLPARPAIWSLDPILPLRAKSIGISRVASHYRILCRV